MGKYTLPPKKKDGRSKPKKFNVNREWFYQKYAVELVPTRLIASEIGCVDEHITDIAKRFGIPLRGRLKRSVPHPRRIDIDKNEIVRLYVDEEMSCINIAKILGGSHTSISARLAESGIDLRHHNHTKRGKPSKNKIYIDPFVVISLYAQKYESGQTIADKFGVSRQVIGRILKDNNVPAKPMSEARDFWGKNSPNWRNDLSNEEREKRRDINKQKAWREEVFRRDGYTCQKCGDNKGGNLNSHHIIPHSRDRSVRWNTDNGITFCSACHVSFHNKYGYTKCDADSLREYLEEASIA